MNLDIHNWCDLGAAGRRRLLCRPALRSADDLNAGVAEIVAQVRREGDAAVRMLTHKFDGIELQCCGVNDAEFVAAEQAVSAGALRAIDVAIRNVSTFHEAQRPRDVDVATAPGVRCQRISQPIDSVGLYVPAGSAALPSAAIMLAVPAGIAGCRVRVLCTPPRPDGCADPAVLIAARRCGIDQVFKIGGAQAIAAMAYGTATIPRVDKIFGPGNAWVTAAKQQVSSDGCAIDMPAGPSEVLVIADADASPEFVAADLLSQAEHGEDSQVLLVSTCRILAQRVCVAIARQLPSLERRAIAEQALRASRFIVVDDLQQAIALSNEYAPEHLLLHIRQPRRALKAVRNAGSVFLGPWSPESAGDYCSGTNHVLPTNGAARSHSGLGVDQFMRHMTVQELTRDGLRQLAPAVVELAMLEGLDAHAQAVRIRLDVLEAAEATR